MNTAATILPKKGFMLRLTADSRTGRYLRGDTLIFKDVSPARHRVAKSGGICAIERDGAASVQFVYQETRGRLTLMALDGSARWVKVDRGSIERMGVLVAIVPAGLDAMIFGR